jgi:hypothetical protein
MRVLKLLALSLALLVTHGSATAALSHRAYTPAVVQVAAPVHPAARVVTDGAGVPPAWGLLVAGLLGTWAIGRRRIASIGNGRRP